MEKNFTNLETYIKNNFSHKEIKQINIDKIKDEIGMDVIIYCKKHGLTQAQLAKIAHVPQSSINRIENGENTGDDTLIKVASAMHKQIAFV